MEQTTYDVFISYSRKDYVDEHGIVIPGNEVSKIKDALTEAGITYWFDEEGIYFGDKFTEKIPENIEASQVFLFLSTKNACASPWTSKEIACADEFGKYIIPVHIDKAPYNKKIMFRIADLNYVDYGKDPDKGRKEIVKSIKVYLKKIKAEEEERLKNEEEERYRKELQNKLIKDIQTSVKELNIEETKLDLERSKLLVKTEKVLDTEQRKKLKTEIAESSPMRKKSQDEIKMLQEQVTELKTERDFLKQKHNPSTHKKNKWVHIIYCCIILILFSVICIRSFIEHNSEKNTRQIADTMDVQEVSVADSILEFYVDNVKFNMVRIEGGSFMMGAQNSNSLGDNYDSEALSDENPVHIVTLSNFYIGETEVTQTLWEVVMGADRIQRRIKNRFKKTMNDKGDDYPMCCVEWYECQEFINKLNLKTGKNFRLPTEAEWEYAARGGKKSQGYNYAGSKTIGEVAWYTEDSGGCIHPVKGKMPNELGLYDMSGNVWEWCRDLKGKYNSSEQTNPTSSSGQNRVLRGGSWDCHARGCRVSSRNGGEEYFWDNNVGFRLVLPSERP